MRKFKRILHGSAPAVFQTFSKKRQRSAAEAFTRWHRHVRADFIGRNLRRWPAQLRHYLKLAKGLTIAPWARAWPAPPAPAPTVTSPPG